MSDQPKKLTTASGKPYTHNQDSKTIGPRGPILLEDFVLHEKMAHFNRERLPERVVHAKGSGAFGTFTVTNDVSQYTRAKLFNTIGKQTPLLLRFSTVGGEKGSADSERDPRGFAIKFYTEDGNYDLVGNNTPVFFIKDPKKFGDFIHTQKRDPHTNLKSPTMMWDFWSLNPESLHQVLILMSDRGTPLSYRHMHGFSSHTFSLINDNNERVWVKFHFKSEQKAQSFNNEQAVVMRGLDPDHAQRDLVEAINTGNFPRWKLKIQVMTQEEAKTFRWNPFDITKVWPHGEFPLMDVGVLELNRVPDNFHAEVEQAAFAPAHVVDGISFSPDKMLQGRLLSYPDAHRYRLGGNYEQIPVNRPVCPVHNYQRDGLMAVNGNGGQSPNYFPNSFDGAKEDASYEEPAQQLDSFTADWFDRNANDDDHYSQPRALFRQVMTDAERQNTIHNITGAMSGISGPKRDVIVQRQLNNWYRVDEGLGMAVAKALGVSIILETKVNPQGTAMV
ncbi:catalase [soil metagenome]